MGLDDFGFPMLQNDPSFVSAESQPEANSALPVTGGATTLTPLEQSGWADARCWGQT